MPMRRVLADYDAAGVYVYQAFRPAIVAAAVAHGTFAAGFNLERMTWIKPSLGWMLHRSGYATKHRQEAIARIHLSHAGWLQILQRAVPTTFNDGLFADQRAWSRALQHSDVRYQWDPDRDLYGVKLDRRAIQLGLSGPTVSSYVYDWIVGIEDATDLAQAVGVAVLARAPLPAVPHEREYPLPLALQQQLGYDH